jgi:hypothetical protein
LLIAQRLPVLVRQTLHDQGDGCASFPADEGGREPEPDARTSPRRVLLPARRPAGTNRPPRGVAYLPGTRLGSEGNASWKLGLPLVLRGRHPTKVEGWKWPPGREESEAVELFLRL